ncbi:MAG: hypothetical protein PHF60_03445 [Candidatus ainarchaeum sp.]|nr:hypothetical protein [Candidatus ainarchaeum sp.]
MKMTALLALFIMLSLSSAVVIDATVGESANQTAAEKCKEADVQAIYFCSGDVVKVVSSVPGEGSTFYKPDGTFAVCPDVAPSQMGAACMYMMTPNYCPNQVDCSVFIAPEPQAQNESEVNETEASPKPPANQTVSEQQPPAKNETASSGMEVPKYTGESESLLGYMAVVIAALGIAAVAVLFFLFKKSLAEDEA